MDVFCSCIVHTLPCCHWKSSSFRPTCSDPLPPSDRTGASVQLQTDTTKFVTRTGEPVKIVVTIRASPQPEVIWYDPDGEEIVNQGTLLRRCCGTQTVYDTLTC